MISDLETALQAMDKEITRLRTERDQLRAALLDAIAVFEINPRTEFRRQHAALIERAQSNAN